VQSTRLAYTYTQPFVIATFYDTPNAGAFGSYKVLNLVEAGTELVRAATRIAAAPLADFASETGLARSADLDYVLTNGVSGASSHESLHTSLETGYQLSLDTRVAVMQSSFTAYISMATVLGSILLLVFVPILASVETSKDAIVLRFIQLPRLVRESLLKEQEQRMAALRFNFNDEEEEEEEDENAGLGGDAEEEVDWEVVMLRVAQTAAAAAGPGVPPPARSAKPPASSPLAVSKATAGGVAPASGAPASGSAESAGMALLRRGSVVAEGAAAPAKVVAPAAKATKAKARGAEGVVRVRKGYGSMLLMAAKFLGPIVALFCFFTAIYVRSQSTLALMLPVSSAQVAASNRASCTSEIMMDLYRFHGLTQDRLLVDLSYHSAIDTVQCITYHQKLLLFTCPLEDRGIYDIVRT
jgi:hypothetical protein